MARLDLPTEENPVLVPWTPEASITFSSKISGVGSMSNLLRDYNSCRHSGTWSKEQGSDALFFYSSHSHCGAPVGPGASSVSGVPSDEAEAGLVCISGGHRVPLRLVLSEQDTAETASTQMLYLRVAMQATRGMGSLIFGVTDC